MVTINSVLRDAKADKACKNPPALFTENDFEIIDLLIKILEPMANLTDMLQGDGITSSMVIIGVLDALNGNLY